MDAPHVLEGHLVPPQRPPQPLLVERPEGGRRQLAWAHICGGTEWSAGRLERSKAKGGARSRDSLAAAAAARLIGTPGRRRW